MIIFTVFFGGLAKMPSDGIPYPIFTYCALVPWTYFAGVLAIAGNSLVSNSTLLTKVYFPRVLLPAATAVAGLLDFVVSLSLLVVMMAYYRVQPTRALIFAPLVVLAMVLLTAGVSMFVAAATVRYRDMKYILPFAIQLGVFVTPIIYPVSMIPAKFRPVLALNPCWGIVDGFRACLFPGRSMDFTLLGTSLATAVLLFIAGAWYFRATEKTFADII
jgi:lipopolysaccharide transport system permease protein